VKVFGSVLNGSSSIAVSDVRIERAIDPSHRIGHAVSLGVLDCPQDVDRLVVHGFQPLADQRSARVGGFPGHLGQRFQALTKQIGPNVAGRASVRSDSFGITFWLWSSSL